MLVVEEIHTCYGESQALFGVSLMVEDAEVVTLLGRNGMGKSTTIRSPSSASAPFAPAG